MPNIILGAVVFAAGYACAKVVPEGLVDMVVKTTSDLAKAGAEFASRSKAAANEDAEDAAAEKKSTSK